jgi:hypothetical protein
VPLFSDRNTFSSADEPKAIKCHTNPIERIKELDKERAALFEQAKEEALRRANQAVETSSGVKAGPQLGFFPRFGGTLRFTSAGATTRRCDFAI